MSGFEVVGVILGAWPIVVNAMTVYKATKGGKGLKSMVHELRVEKVIYSEFVCHLLRSDVAEAELIMMSNEENPDLDLWKKKALHDTLKKRLGKQRTMLLFEKLEEIRKLLGALNEKLGGNDVVDDGSHNKFRLTLRQWRYNFAQSSVKQDLEALRSHNINLQRLFNSCPVSAAERRPAAVSAPISSETFKKISAHANDLHEAICSGYSCSCDNPHPANLGTRRVLPKYMDLNRPFDLLFTVDEDEDDIQKRISDLDINTAVSPSEKATEGYGSQAFSPISYHSTRDWSPRTSVSSSRSPLENIDSISPPKYQSYQRGRSVSVSESKSTDGVQIRDLCKTIKSPIEKPPTPRHLPCLGTLGHKEKQYTMKLASMSDDSPGLLNVICLDNILTSGTQHTWDISRQKRMDLALSLSLAILQLFSTKWINIWWTWKDFCMVEDDKEEKSQIFVTKNFYSTQNPLSAATEAALPSLFWMVVGEQILTRLGFALVELALGKRLSDIRIANVDENGDHDMVDLAKAIALVESGAISREAGTQYSKAVSACLKHQIIMPSGGLKELNSKRAGFQLDFQEAVISPIRDFYDSSWGLTA